MEKRKINPHKPKVRLGGSANYHFVKTVVGTHKLNTICQSGNCPNIGECWGNGTATFMIAGDICTRNCQFCSVKTGKPKPLDTEEPEKLAESVKLMRLKHVVITSVDRDDLPDLGASHWAKTINTIKKVNPETTIETLIPDFEARQDLLNIVINAGPTIISHNIETVERISNNIRRKKQYQTSLLSLKILSSSFPIVKSGIMLGLGETEEEVLSTMDDLVTAGCQILTIGQYLQPTSNNIPVLKYYSTQEFENFRNLAIKKGFRMVESSPLVRSSYHAEKHV